MSTRAPAENLRCLTQDIRDVLAALDTAEKLAAQRDAKLYTLIRALPRCAVCLHRSATRLRGRASYRCDGCASADVPELPYAAALREAMSIP